jgi:LacI family transcriptional regulator
MPVSLPKALYPSFTLMLEPHTGVTIRDVARAAGVSVSTVSRVLNGKDDVAPETAAAVRRVIEDLGYASSLAARGLRSRATRVVGVIVQDMWHPFITIVIKGINEVVAAHDYDLLAYASARRSVETLAQWEQRQVAQLNGAVTDGIIVVTPRAATYRTAFPVVAVDPNQADTEFPAVISTNRQGVLEAMRYLLALGHRRIGFITGRMDLQSAVRRFDGYRDALGEAGIPFVPALTVEGDYTREKGFAGALRLLTQPDPPTAIMASSDDTALGVYDAAAKLGLRIPDDLSVIGFDNTPAGALLNPPLTTVDQFIEKMGALAAEILLNLIQGRLCDTRVHKVPTRLVVRQSCRAIASGG